MPPAMDNPFSGYGTRVSGSRLVGRHQEKIKLARRIKVMAGAVNVVGAPRIGKSSLVFEVIDDLIDKSGNCWAQLDASSFEQAVGFVKQILKSLAEDAGRKGLRMPPTVQRALVDISSPVESVAEAFALLEDALVA